MFLLSFPDELLSCILANWLDLKDVVRMDSALCSGRLRKDFLSLLSDKCTFQTIVVDNIISINYVRSNDISIFRLYKRFSNQIKKVDLQQKSFSPKTHFDTHNWKNNRVHHSKCASFGVIAVMLNGEVVTILQQRKTSSVLLNCCDFDELRFSPEDQKLKITIFRIKRMCRYYLGLPSKLNHLRTLDLAGLLVTDQILVQFSLRGASACWRYSNESSNHDNNNKQLLQPTVFVPCNQRWLHEPNTGCDCRAARSLPAQAVRWYSSTSADCRFASTYIRLFSAAHSIFVVFLYWVYKCSSKSTACPLHHCLLSPILKTKLFKQ